MADLIKHSPLALSHYRQQLSLSRDFLAKKTGIALSKIEKGEQEDNVFTYSQIQKLATRLFIPDFYLLTDHTESKSIPNVIDHRNLIEIDNEAIQYNSQKALHELISNRNNLIYIYESLDIQIGNFDLFLTGNDPIGDANLIRNWLKVDNAKFKTENNDDYYRSWRTLIEKNDVIIIELSSTKIGSEGMALYYDTLPIIAILSSGQSHSRRLFTMIHELVHLGLRQSAIDGNVLTDTHHIERYCNQVAGHVLLPQEVAHQLYSHVLSLDENIKKIRKSVKVSKQAIAIQLKLLGLITQQMLDEYLHNLDNEQDQGKSGGFGISQKSKTHNQFGNVYLQQVISAVWNDTIPINTAMKILHLKDVQDLTYLEQKVFS